MSERMLNSVAILGIGLIGGSLGLALRQRGLAGEVVGYSRTAATRDRAIAVGAADRAAPTARDCVAGADLVYLAAPVASIVPLLREVAPALKPGCLVTDAGSSKAEIVAGAAALELGGATFVGGHPMTGSEAMGIDAARGDLFEQMTYVVTPTAATPPQAADAVASLAAALGSRVLTMSPDDHDAAVAAISHLPHLLAAALVLVTEARSADGEPVYELTAGSWASATRVAASGGQLWREILASNRAAALAALSDFEAALGDLRACLADCRDDDLEQMLETVRQCKLAHPGRQRP